MRSSSGHHGRGKSEGGKGAHSGHGRERERLDAGGRHDRTRARRGDVRTAIMVLLAEQPMHGYQLMQAISDSTDGIWRPSPGAIYPTIAHLQDEGLITAHEEDGRKILTLTTEGRRDIAERSARRGDPFTGFTTNAAELPLTTSLDALAGAVDQVRRNASAQQVAAAEDVLAAACRSLYLILAGEGAGHS